MNLSYSFLEHTASQVGNSFYLFDSQKFINNYTEMLQAFRSVYSNTIIAYSYKTNYTPRICALVDQLGGYAEVVSEMEYQLALKIGVQPQKIIVNGPYKNKQALSQFLLNGSCVNLDSWEEVLLTKELARNNPAIPLTVGIRCSFQLSDTYTSRFGFDIEQPLFYQAVEQIKAEPNIRFNGLHCHFPDRNPDSFRIRMDRMLRLVGQSFSDGLLTIDMGGGYFGKMKPELADQFSCKVPDYQDYARYVAGPLREFYSKRNEKQQPTLIIEPGTALVADVMQFVVRVNSLKKNGGKTIATTTGSKFNLGSFGSPLNLPVTAYQANPTPHDKNHTETIDISGYTCIENDYLYRGYLGNLETGDFLVFDNAGSYSVVFKPPFILPNVPILEWDSSNNTLKTIRRKEEFDDVFRTFIF